MPRIPAIQFAVCVVSVLGVWFISYRWPSAPPAILAPSEFPVFNTPITSVADALKHGYPKSHFFRKYQSTLTARERPITEVVSFTAEILDHTVAATRVISPLLSEGRQLKTYYDQGEYIWQGRTYCNRYSPRLPLDRSLNRVVEAYLSNLINTTTKYHSSLVGLRLIVNEGEMVMKAFNYNAIRKWGLKLWIAEVVRRLREHLDVIQRLEQPLMSFANAIKKAQLELAKSSEPYDNDLTDKCQALKYWVDAGIPHLQQHAFRASLARKGAELLKKFSKEKDWDVVYTDDWSFFKQLGMRLENAERELEPFCKRRSSAFFSSSCNL